MASIYWLCKLGHVCQLGMVHTQVCANTVILLFSLWSQLNFLFPGKNNTGTNLHAGLERDSGEQTDRARSQGSAVW